MPLNDDPTPPTGVQPDLVILRMDDNDFMYLWINSGNWAAEARELADRFEVMGGPHATPDPEWKRIYWLGHDYTKVILAKSFLTERGFVFEVAVDAGNDGMWTILTDYE